MFVTQTSQIFYRLPTTPTHTLKGPTVDPILYPYSYFTEQRRLHTSRNGSRTKTVSIFVINSRKRIQNQSQVQFMFCFYLYNVFDCPNFCQFTEKGKHWILSRSSRFAVVKKRSVLGFIYFF